MKRLAKSRSSRYEELEPSITENNRRKDGETDPARNTASESVSDDLRSSKQTNSFTTVLKTKLPSRQKKSKRQQRVAAADVVTVRTRDNITDSDNCKRYRRALESDTDTDHDDVHSGRGRARNAAETHRGTAPPSKKKPSTTRSSEQTTRGRSQRRDDIDDMESFDLSKVQNSSSVQDSDNDVGVSRAFGDDFSVATETTYSTLDTYENAMVGQPTEDQGVFAKAGSGVSRCLGNVQEEIVGTYQDTMATVTQVCGAFTLTDQDINAVSKRIEQVQWQYSQAKV